MCIFLFGQQNIYLVPVHFLGEEKKTNILLCTLKSPHGPAELLPDARTL